MKVALIAPRGLEGYVLHSTMHMALPIPDTVTNLDYVKAFQEAHDRGDFVIMDNGAADGGLQENSKLVHYAGILCADELVVPDVIGDKAGTIHAIQIFLRWFAKFPHPCESIKLMAVAQGAKYFEFQQCIRQIAEIPEITTLGIPRHMLTTVRQQAVRLDLAGWVHTEFPARFEIHMLGASPSWPREVAALAKYTPFVRSLDTALPFNYSLAGHDMETSSLMMPRPKRYFTYDWCDDVSARLVAKNIRTYLNWAAPKA